jgi:hypothetical protein
MIIVDQYAKDRAATSEAIRLWSVAKRAKRWHVSQVTAAAIIEPSRPHTLGSAPWRVRGLDKKLAKSMQRNLEGRRCRPKKSAEKIFNLPQTENPSWYTDPTEEVPAQFTPFRNR